MLWASRRGQGDEFMDPTGTGSKVIPFWRSGFARSDDGKGTREALNLITHYLDASMVRHKGNGVARRLQVLVQHRCFCLACIP